MACHLSVLLLLLHVSPLLLLFVQQQHAWVGNEQGLNNEPSDQSQCCRLLCTVQHLSLLHSLELVLGGLHLAKGLWFVQVGLLRQQQILGQTLQCSTVVVVHQWTNVIRELM